MQVAGSPLSGSRRCRASRWCSAWCPGGGRSWARARSAPAPPPASPTAAPWRSPAARWPAPSSPGPWGDSLRISLFSTTCVFYRKEDTICAAVNGQRPPNTFKEKQNKIKEIRKPTDMHFPTIYLWLHQLKTFVMYGLILLKVSIFFGVY